MPIQKRIQFIFLAFCLFFLNASRGQAGEKRVVLNLKREIDVAGEKRSYYLRMPPSYDKKNPLPLLLVFHGGGSTGARMGKFTGFDSLADKKNFIVVYPDAIQRHWNDGRNISNNFARWRRRMEDTDDVGFVSELIEGLTQEFNIDSKRIFATGISNGGIFSQRLACELSDKIAAIASVDASMPEEIYCRCKPVCPVSVLLIAGTKDPLVPWQGGYVHLGRLKRGKIVAIADCVKYWVKRNGCCIEPKEGYLPDNDPDDGTKVRKEEYLQGKGGADVVLYAVEGGGHTWPGAAQYLPVAIIGKTCKDFSATQAIWDFFASHPKY